MSLIRAAVFYMHKKDPMEYEPRYIGTFEYTLLPTVGSYVRLRRQEYAGYEVERVVHLSPNDHKLDVILVANKALPYFKDEAYISAYQHISQEQSRVAGFRLKQEERYANPDEYWQRRKKIFERIRNGESAETIAQEEGIKPARVRTLYNDWRRLEWDIKQYGLEDKKKNGQP